LEYKVRHGAAADVAMADKKYACFHFYPPKMPCFALICVGLPSL
jgi:hypothetical protein